MLKNTVLSLLTIFVLLNVAQAKTNRSSDDEQIGHDIQHAQQIDCQAIVTDYYDGTRKQVTLCFYEIEIGSCENYQVLTMWRKQNGEFGFIGNPKPSDKKCD